jgi:hypothetical protein
MEPLSPEKFSALRFSDNMHSSRKLLKLQESYEHSSYVCLLVVIWTSSNVDRHGSKRFHPCVQY